MFLSFGAIRTTNTHFQSGSRNCKGTLSDLAVKPMEVTGWSTEEVSGTWRVFSRWVGSARLLRSHYVGACSRNYCHAGGKLMPSSKINGPSCQEAHGMWHTVTPQEEFKFGS